MSLTLIMNWDIKEGLDQEYFEFVVGEWMPGTSRLGLQMVAAWYTLYSKDEDAPRLRAEGLIEDEEALRKVLSSPEWQELHEKLLSYVDNYTQKVVRTTGEFKL